MNSHNILRFAIVFFLFVTTTGLKAEFQDKTKELGLELGNGATAWADYNNDGWSDLYAAGTLWQNLRGKNFTKITSKGPGIWGDFDNDGYLDLFTWDPIQLWKNILGENFEAVPLPEFPKTSIRGACWIDIDNDGFLDLYIGGYENWPSDSYPDVILKNRQGKQFTIHWQQAEKLYRARGVTACDFDQDGDIDIYVSNYRLQENLLWQNDGKGKFANIAKSFGVDGDYNGNVWTYGHTIGSAWGDLNDDGYIDLFVGNFSHPPAHQDRPKFYMNLGPKGKSHFEDKSKTTGLAWQESYASPALGDYDNDGDLDLATAGKLFVNQGNQNNWLKIQLIGDGLQINTSAIGTQIRIKRKGRILTRQVEAGTGEGNQTDLILHFGLANSQETVSLEIRWPNRKIQKKLDFKGCQLYKITYNDIK